MSEGQKILVFLRENKDYFRTHYKVSKIGLFGSFARNDADDKSDIDILVEFDGDVDIYETKQALKEFAEEVKELYSSIGP